VVGAVVSEPVSREIPWHSLQTSIGAGTFFVAKLR
jgi:hypothetical protein